MTDSLQALENRLESATGLERSELLISLSLGYNNLSPAKAQSYAEEALTLAIQERSRSLEAESLNALGRASLGQLAYSEALEQLQKSLSIYEDIDSQEGIAEVLGTIGLVYHSDGERKKALEYLNRSLETAEKSEALNLILESCRSLSELYEKDRNFKKALEYHRRMSELEEKLFSEEKSRIIARIDAVFQTEKAEQEAEINRLRNIELNEKKQLIEAQAESLQRANVKISVHREELIMKNMELEKLLKEKDEFLSRMVKHISDGVMIDDQKGKILYVNDRFLEIFSLSRKDIPKMDPFKCVAPEWREKVREYHLKRLEGEDVPDRFEFEGIKKGGGRIWLEVGVAVVERDGIAEGTQSLVRDITCRKILEAQLLQSQKLDAVGRLAGGVAHDFNNLLTVIKAHSEFMIADLPDTHDLRPDADEISKAADRASTLTRQLLAFSRQQILQPRVLDLSMVVSGLQRMLSRLLSEDIKLVTSFSKETGCVFADESQFEQVIVNLVINARDAMRSGGVLKVDISNIDVDEQSLVINPDLQPGKYVQMSISDTGSGMNADTRARIFEPFYSTKVSDEGSGLGLAMVYGIIRQSKGVIDVSSEPGIGTTFNVYLPRVQGEYIPSEVRVSKSAESGKGERILLVEDDEALRTVILQYLSREEYDVISTGSAEEAVDLFNSSSTHFHFLLTDIVLPGINGMDLASILEEGGFKGQILYMTGYARTDILPVDIGNADIELLEKPFSLAALARRIRDILDTS